MTLNFKFFTNTKGISIVEVLISTFIVMAGITASTSIYLNQKDSIRSINGKFIVQNFQNKLAQSIRDDTAWSLIAADPLNTSLNCLNDANQYYRCPTQKTTLSASLPVYGIDYRPVTNTTHGIDQNGNICSSYPSNDCPWRVLLTWQALCLSPCGVKPIIQVNLDFESSKPSLNLASLNLKIFRGPANITSTSTINLSFVEYFYQFFDATADTPQIRVQADPVSPKAINFKICIADSPANYMNGYANARSGVDTYAFNCYPQVMPANTSIKSFPTFAKQSTAVSPNLGFFYRLYLTTSDAQATTSDQDTTYDGTTLVVVNDNLNMVLVSVTDVLGDLVITVNNPSPSTRGAEIRNANEESICAEAISFTSGFSSITCHKAYVQRHMVGDEVHLYFNYNVPYSNKVTIR